MRPTFAFVLIALAVSGGVSPAPALVSFDDGRSRRFRSGVLGSLGIGVREPGSALVSGGGVGA